MNHLIRKLEEYAADPQDAELNYDLANIYYSIGQTASASTHYMRAAERYEDKTLTYECLLQYALCYWRQGNRKHTINVILKHAISLLPERPEAYFNLSKLYEQSSSYVESYTWASVALGVCDFECAPLRTFVEYPGKYALYLEKGIAAWWWGKSNESREIFSFLCQNYHDKMTKEHKEIVFNNLNMLGSGPDREVFKKYDKSMHDRLRLKFDGSDKIERVHSQVYQDLFVLSALKGKRGGTFLEIGGYTAYRGNNTALLEEEFDWNGVSVEIDQACVDAYRKERRTEVICADATTLDYASVLSKLAPNGVVDYLQLDVEPPKNTFESMLAIPFDKYKFAVITYEHDHYMDMTQSFRNKSRSFLRSHGYLLVVPNVTPNKHAVFEDWWVHPDLVDKDVIDALMAEDKPINNIEEYMFGGRN